jgi:hypothetical protein
MTLEGSGRCKLAELVAYHILGYIYRYVLAAVMNRKCMSYELREDR